MSPALRRGALFVVLGVVPIAAAYACGDFTGDTTTPEDAGSDTAADAPAAIDASADAPVADGSVQYCRARAIAAGYVHACAVVGPTKGVACWGDNRNEQSGADLDAGALRTTPGLVANLDHVEQLALGQNHSCALKTDGTVWCWGANDVGELGNASASPKLQSTPTKVFGIANATQISAGYYHTCARLSDGTVKCWGGNTSAQLGDKSTVSSFSPVSAAVSGVAEIAAGAVHTCARLDDGGIVCWGDNYLGELGTGGDDGGPDARAPEYVHRQPELVEAGAAVRVSAGSYATCGQFESPPFLRCWGNNFAKVLVPNVGLVVVDTPRPVTIPFVLDGGDVAPGVYQTCAVSDEGSLFCWGLNTYGQAGTATNGGPPSYDPAAGVVDHVTTGFAHTCVISDASASCFGWNQYGQLGQGNSDPPPGEAGLTAAHPTPVEVLLPCP